jgi:hypothetical protein
MQVSSVSFAFRRILQVLHLDVLKVDRVLHLRPRILLPHLGVSSSQRWLGIRHPLSLFSMLLTLEAVRDLCGRGKHIAHYYTKSFPRWVFLLTETGIATASVQRSLLMRINGGDCFVCPWLIN